MHQTSLVLLALATWTWYAPCLAAPEPEPVQPLTGSKSPQTLEGILTSIEERLRALDNQHALRFAAPRWELSVETHNRKLEALESKMARIETLFEVKVDKISEHLNSKSLKEDLGRDQLSRKIDVIYERLNHRMSYMESRIENNIAKFQTSLDTTLTRISGQLEHLEKISSDLENDIMEVGTSVEESRVLLVSLNNTLKYANDSAETTNSNSTAELAESVSNMVNVTSKLLLTWEQATIHSKSVEELSRKSLDLVNATRRELQDGIKAVKASASRRPQCPTIPEGTLDYLIEKVDGMSRKNEGNYQKLDTTIERLHMRQELYQESCHRLQLKEPQIEDRISEVLEKIYDSLHNRTNLAEKNYEALLERLKSHHNYVIRTMGHTTNTVIKLSEQMSQDIKSLFTNHPATEKIDSIINSLQRLQDEFQELNETITTTHQLTPIQSQMLLNNTATILKTIQNLNENMTTIIDRLSDYYRNIPADGFEPEADVSSQILKIFNMTEADLTKTVVNATEIAILEDEDEVLPLTNLN